VLFIGSRATVLQLSGDDVYWLAQSPDGLERFPKDGSGEVERIIELSNANDLLIADEIAYIATDDGILALELCACP